MMMTMMTMQPIHWRWNEFKSGRHMPGAKRRNFFRAPPYFVFTSTIVLVSAFVIGQYSFVIFLFFFVLILSVSSFPVIFKSGGTCPVPYGVSDAFMGNLHTKKHDKTKEYKWPRSYPYSLIKQPFSLNAE